MPEIPSWSLRAHGNFRDDSAAMIGAIATVSTALFQIFTVLRNKVKPDVAAEARDDVALDPRGAGAHGGVGCRRLSLLGVHQAAHGEDMRAMREELKELKDELTAQSERPAVGARPRRGRGAAPKKLASLVPQRCRASPDGGESVVYVPACRRITPPPRARKRTHSASPCAARSRLCAHRPHRSVRATRRRAARVGEHRAQFEQDLGGARFTGKSFEYAQSEDLKAVCVNFMQWSSEHPHIARILVQYGFGDSPARADAGAKTMDRPGTRRPSSPPTLRRAIPQARSGVLRRRSVRRLRL